jgi:RNA polymerase sigma factor (TIGR02999 family)
MEIAYLKLNWSRWLTMNYAVARWATCVSNGQTKRSRPQLWSTRRISNWLIKKRNGKTRSHFFAIAAQQMRRILLDHARKHKTGKRAGGEQRVSFQDALAVAEVTPYELLAIEDALQQLAGQYPRQARVVELRFYGGYTEDEVAKILVNSSETVKYDWKFAEHWLSRDIRLTK